MCVCLANDFSAIHCDYIDYIKIRDTLTPTLENVGNLIQMRQYSPLSPLQQLASEYEYIAIWTRLFVFFFNRI